MQVEHEGGQRALKPRQRPGEDDEAGPRESAGSLEVHHPERLTQLEMLLSWIVKDTRPTPAAQLDVLRFVEPVRHIVRGEIRDQRERLLQLRLGGCRALTLPVFADYVRVRETAYPRPLDVRDATATAIANVDVAQRRRSRTARGDIAAPLTRRLRCCGALRVSSSATMNPMT